MDFFEHQDVARKKTGRLVLLMGLAVICITALVYGVVVIAAIQMNASSNPTPSRVGYTSPADDLPYLQLFAATAIGVLVVVGGGSLYKTSQLSGGRGGRVVAESLGGRPIDADTTDPDERRLLNVVEEMAIASGSPVPTVYIMDHEEGINAFAAGWSLDDAVIGVTRGCVQQLSRDQLQGVIAHEFSHILHGDMRINLRLVGVIFGILIISVIGAGVMRSIAYSGRSRRSSNNKDGGAAIIAILLAGLALYIIGYVGVFFGRLIQAAISRQREFLADASAVQYTRNPDGIAGALRRIGGYAPGSKLDSAHAVEHSHMFFGNAVSNFLGSAFATHPPLPERIRRVQPSWEGDYLAPRPHPRDGRDDQPTQRHRERTRPFADETSGTAAAVSTPSAAMGFAPGAVQASAVQQIGELTPAHIQYAHHLIESLPALLRSATQTSTGAQAVVFALLLDRGDVDARHKQLRYLDAQSLGPVAALTRQLATPAMALEVQQRLPLLDLALPALSRLHPEVIDQLQVHVDTLIEADHRLELFEWALRQVLWRHLIAVDRRGGLATRRLRSCRESLSVLLSVLANVGARDAAAVESAFGAAVARLPSRPGGEVRLLPADRLAMGQLTAAVDELAELPPVEQRPVVAACAAAIAADGRVTPHEAELLRAVAETLGVPVPPLLPGQRLV